jgi:hypothetical protein
MKQNEINKAAQLMGRAGGKANGDKPEGRAQSHCREADSGFDKKVGKDHFVMFRLGKKSVDNS